MAIEVTLTDHTTDPLRSLYTAFRVCYSSFTPAQIEARIDRDRITREEMQGKARPQARHLSAIATLRTLGKKEAAARLASLR